MKKLSNKGFTLVELLGVIVILITILLIAVPNIISSLNKENKNIEVNKQNLVLSAAELYLANNMGDLTGTCYVEIKDLVNQNLIKESDLKDTNDDDLIKEEYVIYDKNTNSYKLASSISGLNKCKVDKTNPSIDVGTIIEEAIPFNEYLLNVCSENGNVYNTNSNDIYQTSSYIENEQTKYHECRYVGKSPNNYVKFNEQLYRIIGVFDDNTHGIEKENLIKLISNDSIATAVYGAMYEPPTTAVSENWGLTANFSSTALAYLLNNYYYPEQSITLDETKNIADNDYIKKHCGNYLNKYYSYTEECGAFDFRDGISFCPQPDCSEIASKILNEKYKKYIQDNASWPTPWFNTNYGDSASTLYKFYNWERSEDTNAYKARIGLMYSTDYLYASSNSYSQTEITALSISDLNDYEVKHQAHHNYHAFNWLYFGQTENILSPSESGQNKRTIFAIVDGIVSSYVDPDGPELKSAIVRPTFYLNKDVKLVSGSGSKTDPFIICYDTDCK